MIDRMGRKRALLGLTVMAVAALTIVAPSAALAQSIPNVTDPVGTVVDTVSGGGGGGSTDSGGGGGGGVVENVVEPVKETVDTTTGNVGTVVDNTGGAVDNVAPGDPIGGTKKAVEEIGKRTEDTVNGAVDGVTGTAGDLGGGVLNPVLNAKSPRNRDRDGDGNVSNKERVAAAQQRKGNAIRAAAAERSDRAAANAKDRTLAAVEKDRRMQGTAPVSLMAPPPRETFLTQLADAAEEAAKKLAFPLGLALMVGAFLMVQGRIDRKDAKLALAPIDSEQDLLSFQ